ncbi:hypothetical protein RclHR1_27690004 [Rhizophagus clarus]|uniref:Uncharacterized protein n=1 Tax=Rhizophagus clarus TaxID=94130 RepID=A0A2Z6R257_9GLOM|nr:hypothetical protein RclHR1_27690004 [Rhizophagus clarus]
MHITLKLKTTPRPSNLPAFTYVPFFSLPPSTHLVTSRDSGTDWIKNSMTQGLPWYNHLSGFMGHLMWYLDIKANTTLPDSHDLLLDRYVCSPATASTITLVPGATTTQKNRHWLVALDKNGAPLFGKQLSVQPKKDTCMIVHWTSDCLSFLGDVIRLRPCSGCNSTMEVISPYSWADLSITVVPYYWRLDILPDFSSSSLVVGCDSAVASPLGDLPLLPSPVSLPSGSHYRYYTDGSLINLDTSEVSMG